MFWKEGDVAEEHRAECASYARDTDHNSCDLNANGYCKWAQTV